MMECCPLPFVNICFPAIFFFLFGLLSFYLWITSLLFLILVFLSLFFFLSLIIFFLSCLFLSLFMLDVCLSTSLYHYCHSICPFMLFSKYTFFTVFFSLSSSFIIDFSFLSLSLIISKRIFCFASVSNCCVIVFSLSLFSHVFVFFRLSVLCYLFYSAYLSTLKSYCLSSPFQWFLPFCLLIFDFLFTVSLFSFIKSSF